MNNKRIINLADYLRKEGFSFNDKELSSGDNSKRIILEIKKADRNFLAYSIPNENVNLESNMAKEVMALKAIEEQKSELSHIVPRVVQYSKEDHWFIRESLDGNICGNVYSFDKQFYTEAHLKELVLMLKFLRSIKLDGLESITVSDLVATLQNMVKKSYYDKTKLNKAIGLYEKNKKSIEDPIKKSFLHKDLQPTNLLIGPDGNLALVDFEKSAQGNYYYDFVSLYHRSDGNPKWQEEFKNAFANSLNESFSDVTFLAFYSYVLFLDIVSLDLVYLKKAIKPFHHTNLTDIEAKELMAEYEIKLEQILNDLGDKNG